MTTTQNDPSSASSPPPVSPEVSGPVTNPSSVPFKTEGLPVTEQAIAPMIAKHVSLQSVYRSPSTVSLAYSGEGQGVLGARTTDSTFLEATPQGWRLMGLGWYWWLLMIGVVGGVVFLMRRTVIKPFLHIVK